MFYNFSTTKHDGFNFKTKEGEFGTRYSNYFQPWDKNLKPADHYGVEYLEINEVHNIIID